MLRAFLRALSGHRTSSAPKSGATPADAQKAMVAAILKLRAVVEGGGAEQIAAAVDAFKAKATDGDLEPRELAGEAAKAERMLTVLAYVDRLNRGEGLQAMATMPDGEPAYFHATNVSRETARDDDYGQLNIGEKGIFYDGEKRLPIVWANVLTIGIDRELLSVHPKTGGTPHAFGLQSQREARLAHTVASMMFKQQVATVAPSTTRSAKPVNAPPVTPHNRSLAVFEMGSPASACNFNIVGESHYQGRLRNISVAGRSFRAVLVPEPTNVVDPNAVQVLVEGGDTIGYLSKEDAVYYAPVFELLGKHDRIGTCRAQLTGGVGDKRSFGVLLNLRDVGELLIDIRDNLEPAGPSPR